MKKIQEKCGLIDRDLAVIAYWIELLDKDKLDIFEKEKFPVLIDCRLERFIVKYTWIELLDKDKLVV